MFLHKSRSVHRQSSRYLVNDSKLAFPERVEGNLAIELEDSNCKPFSYDESAMRGSFDESLSFDIPE